MNRSSWLLRGLKFALLAVLFVAAIGFITMSLWNWLVPDLFRGPEISFPQTLGLLLLSRILFGGFHKGARAEAWSRRRKMMREKMESRMASLSPEEQEKFRQKMRATCSGPAWMRRAAPDEAQKVSL
ncbi:hypothetical protein [Hymenobacter sp.]|jgi:hypothetical protein|uniref:hypothetical protein n=1 Tax=Hymenobacter sp. TaxID=1898978 RepID=UPI002EDAFD50